MRRVRAAVLLAIACVTPVACGDDAGGVDGSGTSGGTRTLTLQAAGGDSELAVLRDVAAGFERANEGVRVELVALAEQGEHLAKLATSFAGGRPPDAFLVNHRRMGRFADAGVVEPARLGGVEIGDLYAPPVDAFTFDGELLCLPQNVSSIVTYVNPALFARAGVPVPSAPWSWADALDVARRLAASGVEAIGFDPVLRSVAPFVWSAGGEVVDDTDAPTAVTLDTAAGREALRFLLDLQTTGLDATERAASSPQDRFAAGELAMYLDSRRSVPAFREAGLVFDVVALPADVEPASLLASDGWCVSRRSDQRALAHAFARYAVAGGGATTLAEGGRTVPSLKRLAESDAFLAPGSSPANARAFLDAIPTLHALPSVAQWNEAEERADDTIAQLLAGRTSIDDAVAEIRRETETALAAS